MAIKSTRVAALAAALSLSASPVCSFSFAPVTTHNHAIARPKLMAGRPTSKSLVHHTHTKSSAALPLPPLPMSSTDAAAISSTIDDDKDPPLFEPFLKGIKRDYKMRLPLYKSDVTDGLNTQCLAATLFLFFACLAPAVGFGALFGSVTNGAIGTMEMVSSTAMCGFIYAITSAQPLTIIGSTGPVLAFVATLVKLAEEMNLPFLPLYAWTGIWTSGILLAR